MIEMPSGYGLHALRHFDTEELHAEAYHLRHVAREDETEVALRCIFFAEDLEFVVELVVEFHQFVAVVGNARRRIVFASSFYHTTEVCQSLDYFFFLGRNFHTSGEFFAEDDASILCFAEDGTYSGVGVLY